MFKNRPWHGHYSCEKCRRSLKKYQLVNGKCFLCHNDLKLINVDKIYSVYADTALIKAFEGYTIVQFPSGFGITVGENIILAKEHEWCSTLEEAKKHWKDLGKNIYSL